MHLGALRYTGRWAKRSDRIRRDRGVGHVECGEVVAFDDHDLIGVIAEHAGGRQTGDAAAEYDSAPQQDLRCGVPAGRTRYGDVTMVSRRTG